MSYDTIEAAKAAAKVKVPRELGKGQEVEIAIIESYEDGEATFDYAPASAAGLLFTGGRVVGSMRFSRKAEELMNDATPTRKKSEVYFAVNRKNHTATIVEFATWEEVQMAFRVGLLMPDGSSADGIGRSASRKQFEAKAEFGEWSVL